MGAMQHPTQNIFLLTCFEQLSAATLVPAVALVVPPGVEAEALVVRLDG